MDPGLIPRAEGLRPVSGDGAWERQASAHPLGRLCSAKLHPQIQGAKRTKSLGLLIDTRVEPATAAVYSGARGLVKTCLVPKIK